MKFLAMLLVGNSACGASSFVLQQTPTLQLCNCVGSSRLGQNLRKRSPKTLAPARIKKTALYASSKDRKKGVYSRPSAAIERGSGFFIPGLEGPRVRLLFGLVVLVLTAVNHKLSSDVDSGINSSEGLAVVYSCLLLLQAAIEFEKQSREAMGISFDQKDDRSYQSVTRDDASLVQRWSQELTTENDFKEAVQWSAASFVALTPATNMMLLAPGRVLYQLGNIEQSQSDENIIDGTQAALETLRKSTSGRVSLPPTHPAVRSLVDDENGRCVVLQRIDGDEEYCWLMSSNQLLAAFTSQDLKWLGQLASHVSQNA